MATEKKQDATPDVDEGFVSSRQALEGVDREVRDPSGIDQPKSLKTADEAAETPNTDASPDDEPVRSRRPDRGVLQTLAVGAGEHKPTDSEDFGPDGRPSQRVIQEASQKPAPTAPPAGRTGGLR